MLNKKIKELRLENKLTQSELCEVMYQKHSFKLSPSAIGMYEQGRRQPDNELLSMFADAFNVSVDYLLGRTTERNPVRIVKETKDLLQYLNEGEKEQFLALGIQQIVLKKEVTDPGRLKELMLKAMKIMRAIDDDN
ncbi:MAG: helix-turn-helix domain-containing protein [Alkaliphilus sp.]